MSSTKSEHPVTKRMKELQFTHSFVARNVGVLENDFNQWIDGKKDISFNDVFNICDFLNVEWIDLLNWKLIND
jgi:DNA-binding Xre family transcriptional regulator